MLQIKSIIILAVLILQNISVSEGTSVAAPIDKSYEERIVKMTSLLFDRDPSTITGDDKLAAYLNALYKEINILEKQKNVTYESITNKESYRELLAKRRPSAKIGEDQAGRQYNYYMLLILHGRDYSTVTDKELSDAAFRPLDKEIHRLENLNSCNEENQKGKAEKLEQSKSGEVANSPVFVMIAAGMFVTTGRY